MVRTIVIYNKIMEANEMINVRIDETTLLNLFMNRLEYWTSDDDVLALYEDILKS